MYKISGLKNGLKVATHYLPNISSLSLGVWIAAGGRYEKKELSGISHFLEHLVFKGTVSKNVFEIKETIEGRGGMLNAFTCEEFTCYYAKVLSAHQKAAMEILLDLVLNPLLKPEDIQKERNVIFEEIRMYFDLPQHLVYDETIKLLWPEHPLGRNLAGTFDSLKAISREELLNFKNNYYAADNIIVTACGNVTHETLKKQIEELLIKFATKPEKKNVAEFAPHAITHNDNRFKVIEKNTEQTHLCLGMYGLSREHPLHQAMTLLHVILGANMSSRLFNEVREKKGLAYEINTQIKKFSDCGIFSINAGVITEKIEETIAIILKELNRLTKNAVKTKELSRAKEFCRGQLLMSLEDPTEHMFWIGERLITKSKAVDAKKELKDISRVSPRMLMEAAKMIFARKNLKLCLLGPKTKINREIL